VAGLLNGLKLLDVDLEADREGGRAHTNFAPPGPWFSPRPGAPDKAEREFIDRVLTTFMAGYAAETRSGHFDPEGSGYDRDQSVREWLSYLAPDPGARDHLLHGYLERARRLLESPESWRAVEAVAEALLSKGRLDGDEAAGIARGALRGAEEAPD
jgi:hypothetical protein